MPGLFFAAFLPFYLLNPLFIKLLINSFLSCKAFQQGLCLYQVQEKGVITE